MTEISADADSRPDSSVPLAEPCADVVGRPSSGPRPTALVLAKYYHPFRGGIENATHIFCAGLARHYDVRVIAFNHRPGYVRETIDGVDVERFGVLRVVKSQPISLTYLWAALRARADVVHFHAPNVLASLALMLGRTRRLIAIHHMDIYGRPFLRTIARRLYDGVLRRSDRLVVTSLKNARVSSDLRVPVATVAIPLGIDPSDYAIADADREKARERRRALADASPVIGFVGRHARYKGLDVLVRAVAALPGVHAFIAGDGPYRPDAQALARTLGVDARVHFMGEISHKAKLALLSTIDVFVFPSTEITEAFGISQLEAMMMRAPVVASDLQTGVNDIAIDGETAITVPPGDAPALAHAVRRMLDDAALRDRLVERAHDQVLARFTTAHMVARFNALNRDVLRDAPVTDPA